MRLWKPILTVALGLAAGIFFIQNRSPELPLVLGRGESGLQTQPLPASAWLLLAAVAGFVTGILLQLLYAIPRPQSRSRASRQPQPSSPEAGRPAREPAASEPQAGAPAAEAASSSEWGNTETRDSSEDWDIETPPERPSSSQSAPPVQEDDSPPSEPETSASRDRVFDANYRVIRPPLWSQPPAESEDDDTSEASNRR